jgi:hypothetical protein
MKASILLVPSTRLSIIERDAVLIIPIRKSGRLWKKDCPAARAGESRLELR